MGERADRAGERGQVLVWIVFAMLVLLGAAAFVLDYGNAASVKRHLQATADAAALAGAGALPDVGGAVDAARSYGAEGRNPPPRVQPGSLDETVATACSDGTSGCDAPDEVVVRESAKVETWFARVIGVDTLSVHAAAAACRDCVPSPAPVCTGAATSISAAFSGTPIQAGTTIWFRSTLAVTGVVPPGTSVRFTHQSISVGGRTLAVPDARVTFSDAVTEAATSYDDSYGSWVTVVPSTTSGNVFLSGVMYTPDSTLPGGLDPVTWHGDLVSTAPGLTVAWKWGAAVYLAFGSAYGELGVKPVDDAVTSAYANDDPAGTPENFTDLLTMGARN